MSGLTAAQEQSDVCGSSSSWLCCPEKLTNDVRINFADKDAAGLADIPPTNVSPQEVENFIGVRYCYYRK